MQVRKQQLELDMEQQTDSKQEKEYIEAVYCHPAHLTWGEEKLLDVHLIGFGPHYKQLILCWVYLSTFHAKMGSIKDRNGMDLKEVEDIKKRWQEYTKELYKKRSS